MSSRNAIGRLARVGRLLGLSGLVLACLAAVAEVALAQALLPADVPPALREWIPWVTANDATYGCTRVGDELVCAWPGTLELSVQGNDVSFVLQAVVDRRRGLPLPGGEGQWPVDVREGTRELAVTADENGVPIVWLDAGTHRVEGRVHFGRRPESIRVPAEIARVMAVVNPTTRVPLERASEGVVALAWAAPVSTPDAATETTDSLSLDVVRRISDGIPLCIETQITARIGGRARSISLGRALVAGSVPSAVESSLPIQVSPNGDIVLQAQSGTHRIRITALVANPSAQVRSPELATPWPDQEIWLFAPSELHRQVEIEGASSIDPQSPAIPEDWRSAAAYVLHGGESLTLREVRRGEADPPPNGLAIERTLWLDFDGSGFTARDQLTGEMHRAGRLDLLDGDLGRVSVGGVDQLITLPPAGPRSARGIEVRNENLSVEAEWRSDASAGDIPAVGWSEDARSLQMTLNLPPGFTLFATKGVDRADAWLSRWDVGPLFLVLLIAVIFARLFGKPEGVVALATMVLIFHEDDAPTFLWLAVLVPLAVLRLFKKGIFARLVFVACGVAALGLVVVSGRFVAAHLRYALHPQLYTEERVGGSSGGDGAENYPTVDQAQDEGGSGVAAAPAAVAPESDGRTEMSRQHRGSGDIANVLGGSGSSGFYGVRGADDNWIDPNAVVQTGHGLVSWQHTAVSLAWSGPVARDHRVHLYLVPPGMQRALALARAAGLLMLLLTLFRKRPVWPEPSDDTKPAGALPQAPGPMPMQTPAPAPAPSPAQPPPAEPATTQADEPDLDPGATPRLVLACFTLAFALSGSVAQAQPAPAADAPSPQILGELHDRLAAVPECGAHCARIGETTIDVIGDAIRVVIVAHADALTAVPLPGPATSFIPTTVLVDGVASHAMRIGQDGHLWLRLVPGVHRVELGASLAGRASIALSFADVPGRLVVHAQGWTASGVDENGLVHGSLELRRQLGAALPATSTSSAESQANARTADVPVWVGVDRHVDIGVQWLVTTTIRRISTTSSPAVVRIPALPGETILGTEAVLEGSQIVVTLGQGVPELAITSSIRVGGSIAMQMDASAVAPNDVHRSESWSFACSPLWHCTHDGIAPIRHAVDGSFRPTFAPYPGDRVTITTTRLRAAPGSSFTVDGATMTLTPGERSREADLVLEVRTSVSNTLTLGLPNHVDVERVDVDGERRAVQVRGHHLSIGIAPQNRRVAIHFRESRGLDFVTTTPRITIPGSAVDIRIVTNLPSDRWVLCTSGPSWGPIVLYWGHLTLVLLVAILLGRAKSSPLKTYEWALLALGLTQIPLVATMIVAGWFFFVVAQHRRVLHGVAFNVAQVAASMHAFIAACILIAAAWVGLNERPDMQIVGNGSSSENLVWYADRASHVLPTATFVSVSVWLWKGLMLAWAFWLAYSVVRWAIWAVTPFREGGFFDRTTPHESPRQ